MPALISEITNFVCGTAMKQFRVLAAAATGHGMRLAINISGIEVRDGVLPAMLRQHVRDAGLSMSMLELELTESGLMFSDVGRHPAAVRPARRRRPRLG